MKRLFLIPLMASLGMLGSLAFAAGTSQTLLSGQVPDQLVNSDGYRVNYELGMKFLSDVDGQITAIRFYKSSQERSAKHTGRIFSASGQVLASVEFSGEGASGWQTQNLTRPLSIKANRVYVVGVNTGRTYYVATTHGFDSMIQNKHLRSMSSNSGVYGPVGSMPTSSWSNSNYFRDIVFVASANVPAPTPAPAADNTAPSAPSNCSASAVSQSQINLICNASVDNVGVTGYRVYRNGTQVGTPNSASFSDTALSPGTAYEYTVKAVDAAGNLSAASNLVSATTQSAPTDNSYNGAAANGIPAGFPNSTNTGYVNAPDYPGALTDCSHITIQSNHTYEFCDFSGGLDIGTRDNPVTNVKFYASRFHGKGESAILAAIYGDNITFDYDTFAPETSAPPVSHTQGYEIAISADGSYYTFVGQLTVTHCDLWGFGGAVDTHSTQSADKPQVFRDNWIHDARGDGGIDHTDGIGTTSVDGGGKNIIIDHNSILSEGNTNALAFQAGQYSYLTITNNYFSGFGYTINLGNGDHQDHTVFTGNVFGTNIRPDWGPLYGFNSSAAGNVWQRNYIHFVPGTSWTSGGGWKPVASDDGKFWTPNGVSSTDSGG